MFKGFLTVFLFFILSSGGCATSHIDGAYLIEGGYQITVPKGIKVKETSPIDDFVIYELSNSNDVLVLKLYVGNQPDIIVSPDSEKDCEYMKRSSFTINCLSKGREEHVYVKLDSTGWPQFAHFSYIRKGHQEDHLNKNVIASLKKRKN